MNIVVDAMGGDHAPENVVAGVIEALKEYDTSITLVGVKDRVETELQKYSYPKDRIQVIHASEVVDMHEPAVTPIRKKKDSSITVGVKLLKEPGYHGFISAGNTGAVVAASTILLGMLKGVERPAIGVAIPTLKDFSFLLDVGANAEPKPIHLVHSALMAKVYVREVLGKAKPSIGMLNIGEEAGKGGGFAKDAYKIMEERLDPENFIGNVEANEVYIGRADCIVCDGFVGNVVIKVSEGLLEATGQLMKREIKKDFLAMAGAWLMKRRLEHIKKFADYSEYGGAPLLGVNGLVMIGHGRSSPKAIKNAIRNTVREVEHDILSIMEREITEH